MKLKHLSYLLFLAFAATAPAADSSLKETSGQHLDVIRDGKTIARYMTAHDKSTPEKAHETYKPYLHIFDAAGSGPITKGAGGDFTHHRGIYLGWNKITVDGKTYDRWHMKGGDQVHEKFLEEKADGGTLSITSLVKWDGEAGAPPILQDERTFSFPPASAPFYTVVDVTHKVKALVGDTILSGDPEHAGLHYRPAQEVDRSKTMYIYPVENANAHKDLDYPWFGESYSVGGKTYNVVYLNHPDNPKKARISAYRDYGRFGAFFDTAVKKDEVLTLKVRFLIGEGELPSADVIQKAWNEYTGKNEPTPKSTLKPAEGAGKTPGGNKPKPKADAKAGDKGTKPAAAEKTN
ncbi:methane monooxygenase PmoA-like [Roseimicrobium gellanilyticum]|uniref:Methane monooxygenase PmoA-like n=1 Tax=Roseimicrobium gellanilyticum TaxID=748857 RepID=A0A366HRI6_9BACT|nr:DUF6807 family protein [Roseimicrobium gellanilyticum]RBP46291.1 methane monooxygenase PmoA-like [Roseimicrobium gellanilyticum]